MSAHSQIAKPRVYVHSRHPLVVQMMRKLLAADPSLDFAGTIPQVFGRADVPGCKILLLDACSIEGWQDVVMRWHISGGRTVLLVQNKLGEQSHDLDVLYLGVHGSVALSAEMDLEMFQAIHSVAQGKFWFGPGVVDEFVRKSMLTSSPVSFDQLTSREHQVARLIIKGLANKEIGQILEISERTVKFHVSNILQKCRAESRRDLLVRLAHDTPGLRASDLSESNSA